MNWYPTIKTRPAPSCPAPDNLDLIESAQVQEVWAVEGSIGPEVMGWIDGHFYGWFPKLTMDRAIATAARCV